ncbi:MAG: D-sedoheptulose 7-phosphate isomerase [Planctomycetota bacterium]
MATPASNLDTAKAHEIIETARARHIAAVEATLETYRDRITAAADAIVQSLAGGGTLFLCGNGGSAADAQHIAAEFVGRYQVERQGLSAVALTVDTSILTCISNDYSFEQVFARQVRALMKPGDVLLAISTSGKSPNVLEAAKAAREIGGHVIALTGGQGGPLAELGELSFVIPSDETARIQECHILIGHLICQLVDASGLGQ